MRAALFAAAINIGATGLPGRASTALIGGDEDSLMPGCERLASPRPGMSNSSWDRGPQESAYETYLRHAP